MDIRSAGSGNIGATNVARVIGVRLGLLVLILDVAKGMVPVLVARAAGGSDAATGLACVCAVLGHIFPIFARFRGGKGVATAAGAFLAAFPAAVGCALAVFAIVIAIARIVSLASLISAMALSVAVILLAAPGPLTIAALVITAMLFFTHRENLRRLRAGEEPQFRIRR